MLYNWETAKKVCPTGWRLPSKRNFKTLLNKAVGSGSEAAYNALKEGGSSGFSALLGGWRSYSATFYGIDGRGYWWSSSEHDTNGAWYIGMYSDSQDAAMENHGYKNLGFSVRCVKDN